MGCRQLERPDSDGLARLFAEMGRGTMERSELAGLLKALDDTMFTDSNTARLLDGFDATRKTRVSTGAFVRWICEGLEVQQRRAPSPFSRHLVLHFDINKTLVMLDSVTSKSMADVASHVIASSSWGIAEDLPEARPDGFARWWRCTVTAISSERPSTEAVSYVEFLEGLFPDREGKQRREGHVHRFTQPGEPGEMMRSHLDAFMAALRLPAGIAGTEEAALAGLRGDTVFIIPAFFELLIHLKRVHASFCIVFRTFGQDLGDVVTEFNAFCEGRHPLFPGVVFDGRDGEADYRISFGDPRCFGTFLRRSHSGAEDALVYGTLEQPSSGVGLEFYDDGARFPHIEVVRGGILEIHRNLRSRASAPCTLAFRDHFSWWRSQDCGRDTTRHTGGKLMVLEPYTNCSMQNIFFDDNIAHDSPRIVDVRLLSLPLKRMSVEYLRACHIVKAEPLESVTDTAYFIRHVERLVAAYDRRIAVCQRMKRLLVQALRAKRLVALANRSVQASQDVDYNPWNPRRRASLQHARKCEFPEEEEPDDLHSPEILPGKGRWWPQWVGI